MGSGHRGRLRDRRRGRAALAKLAEIVVAPSPEHAGGINGTGKVITGREAGSRGGGHRKSDSRQEAEAPENRGEPDFHWDRIMQGTDENAIN
jgi:hypothetical protein